MKRITRYSGAFVCGTLTMGVVVESSQAQPVYNPENGHYYEHIDAPGITWVQAEISAQSGTYLGVEGHLATLATEQENNFILGQAPSWEFDWIGGVKSNGNWTWITGELWSYTRWCPNEPNGDSGSVVGVYWRIDCSAINGGWDDRSSDNTGPMRGYIIEFDVTPPVPTISDWGLVVMGLLTLIGGTVVFEVRRSIRSAATHASPGS